MNTHAHARVTDAARFDLAAVETHIALLHQLAAASGTDGCLVLFAAGENPTTGRKEGPLALHFRIGDVAGMVAAVQGWAATPHLNAYAPFAVFRKSLARGDKGAEADVVAVLALVADMDHDKGRGGALPLKSPYVIESSPGNYQAVYPLARALTVQEAKPLAQALADAVGCDYRTKDVSGVWRIPGALNWPNRKKVERGRSLDPQPVRVARPWTGELIDPDALRGAVAAHVGPQAEPRGNHADGSGDSVEQLLACCGAGLRKLISAPPAPGEDRSATAFSVICSLMARGFADGEIVRLIEAHPHGIGARYSEGNLEAELRRARDWQANNAGRDAGREKPSGSEQPDPGMWANPDVSLLGTGRRPAPPFPCDLLGPFWADWCARRAEAASAPVDYVATALLTSVSALLANVRWPVAGAGWSEPPVLWTAEVGPPSSSKSPAIDTVLRLVAYAEDRLAFGFDAVLRDHETAKEAAKARRDEWQGAVQRAIKALDDPPPMPREAEAPEAPVRPRIRVGDTTAERLGALAAGLPRGLMLVRDELAGWFGGFDRYGGGGADRAFAVEAYGGRSYVIDRVKNPEPIRIPHLSLAVLGGVQPDKVSVIIDGPDDRLASRLLWAWPESSPSFKLVRRVEDDREAQAAFARLADLAMGSDDLGRPEPKRIPLTPDAESVIEEFARDMQERGEQASGIYAGTLGKARGHALRLACVVEHLWWCATAGAEPTTISADATTAAAALVDSYFVPMAERTFGDAAIPVAERGAMVLARSLQRPRCAPLGGQAAS